MKVKAPIFIIGAGRSGSSIFHRMFSTHPNVAWLTGLYAKYPTKLELIRYLTYVSDIPFVGTHLRTYVEPGECYEFWEQICHGFSTPCRDLRADDVTIKNKKRIQAEFARILTKGKDRLLIKLTGWPRIGFLREIFPDAKFIHMMRDGRAVTNSILHVNFWWGWRGPQNWRWGELSSQHKEEWNKHNQSFIALAGIQWKIQMDAMEVAKKHVDDRNFMEVKYEHLCQNPIDTLRETVEFCELDWSRKFEKNLSSFKLNSRDFKWEEEFTQFQRSELEEVLGNYLERYGYVP
jgi:hypothetical protein